MMWRMVCWGMLFSTPVSWANPPQAPKSEQSPEPTPAGWSPYVLDGYGIQVMGPSQRTSKNMDEVNPFGSTNMIEFTFPDGQGSAMLMVSTYDKAVGYDLEVGLDGACNGAVQNISGLILEYTRSQFGPYSSRVFQFRTQSYGTTVVGKGRGIAIAPHSIVVAMTFMKDNAAAKALGDTFMNTLTVVTQP